MLHAAPQAPEAAFSRQDFCLHDVRGPVFIMANVGDCQTGKVNSLGMHSHCFLPYFPGDTPCITCDIDDLFFTDKFFSNPIEGLIHQIFGIEAGVPLKEFDQLPTNLFVSLAGQFPIGMQAQQQGFKPIGGEIAFSVQSH